MRELIRDARNIIHSIVKSDDGNKIVTKIEAVLHVMNRKPVFFGTGIAATEELETIRFELRIDAAVKLIEHIQQWIDDAEAERDMLAVAQDKEVQRG